MKKFLKGLALTIITPILFIATFCLLILVPTKNMFNENMIKKTINNIDIEQMMEDDPEVKEQVEEVFEPLYNESRKLGISDEVINKIINSDEVKGIVADVTSNLTNYVLTGENQKIIKTEDITSLVEKAIDDINESEIYEIKEKDKTKILDVVQKEVDENQDLLPDTSIIEESLDKEDLDTLNTIRFIYSNTLIYYLLGAVGISIIAIILLKLKNYKFIKWISIIVLIASFLTFSASIVLFIAGNMIKTEYAYVYDLVIRSIKFSMILSGCILGLMILMLIIYNLIKKNKNKIKNNG